MDFHKKYLKYKYKYEKLKKIINGGASTPDIIFETENFKVKKSKTSALKNKGINLDFYDFYYTVKNIGVDSTIKNVYSEVLNKALASTDDNIDQLYDSFESRHYCNYMAEKIYGGSDCQETNICQKWDIIWSPEINFKNFSKDNTKVKIYGVTSGIETKIIELDEYILKLLNANKYKWIILPLGVPGHSVSIIIYKNNENIYEIYFNDPNGKMKNSQPSELKRHINFVIKFLKKFCLNKKNYIYKDYLLKDLEPQGGTTLTYIDSKGFCGAFTWMIIFFIVINVKDEKLTPNNIYEYFNYRQSQWNNLEDEVNYKTILDNLIKKYKSSDGKKIYFNIKDTNIKNTILINYNENFKVEEKKETYYFDIESINSYNKSLNDNEEIERILNKVSKIQLPNTSEHIKTRKIRLLDIEIEKFEELGDDKYLKIFQREKSILEIVSLEDLLKTKLNLLSEDEFNKKFYTSEFYEKIIENIVDNINENSKNKKKDLIEFRKNLVDSMDKTNYSLNWFETHILIYLLFVKEFFNSYLPIADIS